MFRRSDHQRTLAAAREIPQVLRVGHVLHQSMVTGPTDHRAQLPVLPRMRPQVQHDLPQLWHRGRFLVMAYATSDGNLRRRTGTSQCCRSKSAFTHEGSETGAFPSYTNSPSPCSRSATRTARTV